MNVSPSARTSPVLGRWNASGSEVFLDPREALLRLREPVFLIEKNGREEAVCGGFLAEAGEPVLAYLPACPPEVLGDPAFLAAHGVRYAYATGAMANGIASAELVEAVSRAGLLGFFGAAGLAPSVVEAAIDRLQKSLGERPFGFNLIHSPNEPDLEAAVCALYLKRGIRRVEASAYLDLTLPIVRYRVSGIRRGADGSAVVPNKVMAKVSRVEVAEKFMSPPPERFLKELVASGELTVEQAALAATIPVADDITAEADSGGHTDNRPLVSLLPTLLALRDRLQARFEFAAPVRVGAAGGVSTPASAAAAFVMGAAYVLTGSVNQACAESGSSDKVRELLAQAGQADTAMAPAADMFEMGVKVQVLKRGTLFAMRAQKLYDIYRAHERWEAVPAKDREAVERDLLKAPFETVWARTREFFAKRDPSQNARADAEPRHKMALVFRWYLGLSSRWANAGEPARQLDYQVWCGPAMGAFNEWAKGSFLEKRENRRVAVVAKNLLAGAAYQSRVQALRLQGVAVPSAAENFRPLPLEQLEGLVP